MAVRGTKPTPTHLHVVTGTMRAKDRERQKFEPTGEGSPEPPEELNAQQRAIWDRYIATAWWLSSHDTPKAHAWVVLYAEFMRAPEEMQVSRLIQMRVFGTELGFDPSARARLGGDSGKKPKKPEDKYFE